MKRAPAGQSALQCRRPKVFVARRAEACLMGFLNSFASWLDKATKAGTITIGILGGGYMLGHIVSAVMRGSL